MIRFLGFLARLLTAVEMITAIITMKVEIIAILMMRASFLSRWVF